MVVSKKGVIDKLESCSIALGECNLYHIRHIQSQRMKKEKELANLMSIDIIQNHKVFLQL